MQVTALGTEKQTPMAMTSSMPALDRQAFLGLLVAQLRNQDPLNPMDNREFVAELAQLNTLEQMESLRRTVEQSLQADLLNQSLSLIGQRVQYQSSDEETSKEGIVERVRIVDGLPTLVVDGQEVLPGDVMAVLGRQAASPTVDSESE